MEEQYQKIARMLLSEIESGKLPEGSMLPTRAQLAGRFKVARATMDRAITLLVRRGMLSSSRGAGTKVASVGRNYHLAFISGGGMLSRNYKLPPRCDVEFIPFHKVESKSARRALSRFDGLIWGYPEERELEWLREMPPSPPHIIVNRHLDEFDYVSTDHCGAIRGITAERLASWPKALPVFLSEKDRSGIVWKMRFDGFVDACRKASRFYENIAMPPGFEERIALLEARLPSPLKRQLILVSGSLSLTGAVMAWARARGLRWGKDILYSDFDNDYPADVWGIAATSFIQDYDTLAALAMMHIIEMIDGKAKRVRVLVPPRRREGQT